MKKFSFKYLFFMLLFVFFTACSSSYGIYHKIKSGDTIYRISKTYNINVDKLKQTNNIDDVTKLKVGDYIFIPGVNSPKKAEIVFSKSKKDKRISSKSENVVKKKKYQKSKKEKFVVSKNSQKFIWPVNGVLSSPFGMRHGSMHEGIDIAVPVGTSVKASLGGKIIFANSRGGYGLVVIIQHKNNWITVYAHNSKLLVSQGQTVKQGEKIALSGKTGRATGPHLHFEIRKGIKPINPLKFLRSRSSHG